MHLHPSECPSRRSQGYLKLGTVDLLSPLLHTTPDLLFPLGPSETVPTCTTLSGQCSRFRTVTLSPGMGPSRPPDYSDLGSKRPSTVEGNLPVLDPTRNLHRSPDSWSGPSG